ncbi:MAG TPA: SDR family oxidoreductase [Nocardioides sp.]|uniref:SDR family oxidoreductase n=1 Tax=Nocardioides sp. TaxID=35761 RepID=UPI002E3439BF|nr:SDR family oxidoreductase [Nocardioides sp.]HEX3930018.1 SDR family oxidoreductase [Nocardioides sp.]
MVGGGASGIGRATGEALAGQGMRVVLMGRSADTLGHAVLGLSGMAEEKPAYVVHDVADAEAAPGLIDRVEADYGSLDVLVLNAGGPPPGRVLDVTDDQWRTSFDLLLLGPLALARAVLPRMAARGFGRIVLVTSNAVRQPQPDLAISVALRAAATAAAKLAAREYADQGVTVNCVAPGPTATERRREILTRRAQRLGTTYADEQAQDVATVPAGRAGQPHEIAAAVAFLATRDAGFVNGTVLTVDGGRTETI